MPNINFHLADGSRHTVTAEIGTVLMRIAVREQFSGILAECGGACSCATCHVHIPPEWHSKLPPMGDAERDMLEFAEGVDADSRLSCQLTITAEMDGLVVQIPESQY